ncbi:3-hydroxy-9,10-secoandrosta-1,3,5(10)-triene-9,17-dione monooxygenase [Paenarthrobacter nicotinovorans]|uniref:3-hydroxy-9,10-secoandrosta-1,3,5(10)-triene-9, 17-dione monooxygenase n=1 Tax=Paenarthrobacter nicotinovorans TaxID=29320 RepID=A0ABT9TRN7_PAENI|nr:acyl-CoA dehydrogenase family protein [Paenarthrobacter nicotinovorans]MDQ0104343.1 3-hydroxy-9,10-secoandrosta-1,3,5(10)-triene-9,17-dione monooxygenase [Paenarthrobacter nicotinovorans]
MMSNQEAAVFAGLRVPEPDLTPDQVIARAAAMRPVLRENRLKAAEEGAYSVELHEAFDQAGFYRLVQPRQYGGYEFSLETYYRVMMEISRGDPGIGWCLTLGTGHTIPLVAHYPEEVVREAFGSDGLFIAPHSASPRGMATPVEGGYLLTGVWPYSSGVAHSTHAMVTAVTTTESGEMAMIVALLPREDYIVRDDWGAHMTMALGASGSNTVELTEVFVPATRTSPFDWSTANYPQGTHGTASTENPLYLGNIQPLYAASLACVQVGAARAALDAFEETILTKKRLYPPQIERYKHPETQVIYGEARGIIDAAQAVVLTAARDYAHLGEQGANGKPAATEDWLALGNMLYAASRLAHEATELLFRSVGSSVSQKGVPLQDYFLATQMSRAQTAEHRPHIGQMLAQAHFNLPPQ